MASDQVVSKSSDVSQPLAHVQAPSPPLKSSKRPASSSGQTPGQRSKRTHVRIPTGCETCRQRRVKCDQGRPVCKQCHTSGSICMGYDTIRYVRPASPSTSTHRLLNCPNMQELTPYDASLFDFFRLHVLPNLSAPYDSEPWYAGISAMFMDCPSVYHAAVALSALICAKKHLSFQPSSEEAAMCATRHYSRAIDSLSGSVAAMHTTTPNTIVLTAILFTAFELYQAHYESAKTHLAAVLRFVEELRQDSPSYPAHWKRQRKLHVSLSGWLDRLDIQLSTFTSSRIQLNRRQPTQGPESVISPDGFRCVIAASHALTPLRADVRELLYRVQTIEDGGLNGISGSDRESLYVEVARQLTALDQWDTQVRRLKQRSVGTHDEQTITVMQITQLSARLQVANCLNEGREMLWDRFLQNFEHLLRMIEGLLGEMSAPCTKDHIDVVPLPVPCLRADTADIYLETGIIPSAYLTALKCRDRKLRRRAMAILEGCRHREGAWDASECALHARRMMILEEKDVPPTEIIPERCRLHRVWYNLSEAGVAAVYCKRRLFETTGEWSEYVVEIE